MTAPMIALFDSNPFFLSLMHDVLTDEGYGTLLWHPDDGGDPLALLRRAQPHLVIVDRSLERRDGGWDLLKRLWGDFETTQIPAVILTGQWESLPVRANVLRAMHCQVVRKPFLRHDLRDLCDLHDLLAAIEQVLGSSPLKCIRGEGAYTASLGDPMVMELSGDTDGGAERKRA